MNPIEGTLPDFIGDEWLGIENFYVHSTGLTGTIPVSLAKWSALRVATFNDTNLVGAVPSGICNADALEVLTADCFSDDMECSCCTECF